MDVFPGRFDVLASEDVLRMDVFQLLIVEVNAEADHGRFCVDIIPVLVVYDVFPIEWP